MLEISTASAIRVKVPVRAREEGAVVDPTELSVALAFIPQADEDTAPISGDFHSGDWETDTTTTPDTYLARCLIGPGGVDLDAAVYTVWVKVTSSPEVPVLRSGLLRIT